MKSGQNGENISSKKVLKSKVSKLDDTVLSDQENEAHESAPLSQKTLEEVVNESKENLATIEPPKKRGRPRKESENKAADTNGAAPVEQVQPNESDEIFKTYGAQAIIALYDYRAENTGFEGFKIGLEEAKNISSLALQWANRFFPNLNSGDSLLAVTVISVSMTFGMREFAYRRFIFEKQKQISKNDQNNTKTEVIVKKSEEKPLESGDFFKNAN